MFGDTGSIANAPIARLNLSSVFGVHVSPPLVDFHTPADAVPMYIRDGIVGSIAMQRARPLLLPRTEPLPFVKGAGPIGTQLQPPGIGALKKTMSGPSVRWGGTNFRIQSRRIASVNPLGHLPSRTRSRLNANPRIAGLSSSLRGTFGPHRFRSRTSSFAVATALSPCVLA